MSKQVRKAQEGRPSIVQHNLVVKAANRGVLDIGKWRNAMRAAERGRVTSLYDLYDDILIDGVLADAIDKRTGAILSSNICFVDADGEQVPEVMELLDSQAWEELLTEIMRARFYGRAAVELSFAPFNCYTIPPKHINLERQLISFEQGDDKGVSYEGDPFIIVLGSPGDLGLLLKAAPYAIYKRGGFGDWSQWIELFGMPKRLGKYNTYDPQSKQLLEEAFEKFGSAPYLIAPSDTTIEHIETSSGNGISYDNFRRACNEEILITILGQTMTTVQGDKGARALGEVHMEVEAGKHKSDLRYIQRILNEQLRPRLEERGYPVAGGKFVCPKEHQLPEVSELLMLSDIIDIPKAWLHEQYGIPMPADGEEIARRAALPALGGLPGESGGESATSDDEDSGGESTIEGPVKNSDREVSLSLLDRITERIARFFGLAPRTAALGANNQDGARPTSADQLLLADVASISQRVIERVAQDKGRGTFNPELFDWLSNDLITALERGFKAQAKAGLSDVTLEHEYALKQDAITTAMEVNLYRFSAGKTLAEVQALNEAFRAARSYDDFKAKARSITDKFNVRWQQTEYNTALLAAESAANYNELMRKTRLFPYWRYRTIGDKKVRAEHAELNGVVLPASDPRWQEIFPPNGWGCRCRVEPVLAHEGARVSTAEMQLRVDNYRKTPDWQNAKKSGWGVNRGQMAVVFDQNQQYLYKLPGKSSRKLTELLAKDYGLDSLAKEVKRQGLPELEDFEGDPAQWLKEHSVLTDHKGRKLQMTEQVFTRHTTGKTYEATRPKLLKALVETLSNPDEVWLNDYMGHNDILTYIRYYQGQAVAVLCQLPGESGAKEYNVRTWFGVAMHKSNIAGEAVRERGKRAVSAAKDPKQKYRRGLLVHKKKRS